MPTIEEYQKRIVEDLAALGIKAPTEEDLTTIALEGVDFGAGSFIAHWSVGRYFHVQTEEDYLIHNRDAEADEQVPQPDLPPRKPKETWHYFYRDRKVANRVHEILNPGNDFKPRYQWVFTAPTATMKNSSNLQSVIDGFGDTLMFWVRIEALEKGHTRDQFGNRKTRHEYNFMALPPVVQAVAELYGYEVPEYDLSPLTAPDASDAFSDEFFNEYMGPSDGDYAGTFYDKQRTALWTALGEPDPRRTAIKGSKYYDKKGKAHPDPLATESDKLSKCLALAQSDNTVWARMVTIPNPGGSGFQVPTITEVFHNEEHATLVAQAELAEKGQEASTATTASHPPLGGWAGGKPEDVVNHITADGEGGSIVSQMANSTPPVRAKLVEDAFVDSWEDLVAWAEYAKEHD